MYFSIDFLSANIKLVPKITVDVILTALEIAANSLHLKFPSHEPSFNSQHTLDMLRSAYFNHFVPIDNSYLKMSF